MFFKLYKNSFSDKMHWSPGFHKADLVGLKTAKKQKQKVPDHRARDYYTGNKHNYKNKPLKVICFDEIMVSTETTQIWSRNINL